MRIWSIALFVICFNTCLAPFSNAHANNNIDLSVKYSGECKAAYDGTDIFKNYDIFDDWVDNRRFFSIGKEFFNRSVNNELAYSCIFLELRITDDGRVTSMKNVFSSYPHFSNHWNSESSAPNIEFKPLSARRNKSGIYILPLITVLRGYEYRLITPIKLTK